MLLFFQMLLVFQVRYGVESGNTVATTSLGTPEQQEASSSSQPTLLAPRA